MTQIVIDEGSSQIKAVWVENGVTRAEVILSDAVDGVRTNANGETMTASWSVDREPFTVDDTMSGRLRTNIREYQISKINRVFTHEILRRIGMSGKEVELSVTLPVGEFFKHDTRPNLDRIQAKKDNTCGEISNCAGVELAHIIKCSVYPEAIPAFYDYCLDDLGQKQKNVNRALVVDFGGTTVDMTILSGGQGQLERFESVRAGVFDIKKELSGLLCDRFKRTRISDRILNQVIDTGKLDGEPVSQEITDAYRVVSNLVLSELRDFEPEPMEFDLILYVGGGSGLVGEQIAKQYGGHYHIPSDPHLSIAKGILKMNLSQVN